MEIMDVNIDAVLKTLDQYDVRTMIHGHTHRPKVHYYGEENQLCRIVLGDWYTQGSVLRVNKDGFELQELKH